MATTVRLIRTFAAIWLGIGAALPKPSFLTLGLGSTLANGDDSNRLRVVLLEVKVCLTPGRNARGHPFVRFDPHSVGSPRDLNPSSDRWGSRAPPWSISGRNIGMR